MNTQLENTASTNLFTNEDELSQMNPSYKNTIIYFNGIKNQYSVEDKFFYQCLIVIKDCVNIEFDNSTFKSCIISIAGNNENTCKIYVYNSKMEYSNVNADSTVVLNIMESKIDSCQFNKFIRDLFIRDSVIKASVINMSVKDKITLKTLDLTKSIIDVSCNRFAVTNNKSDAHSYAKVTSLNSDCACYVEL